MTRYSERRAYVCVRARTDFVRTNISNISSNEFFNKTLGFFFAPLLVPRKSKFRWILLSHIFLCPGHLRSFLARIEVHIHVFEGEKNLFVPQIFSSIPQFEPLPSFAVFLFFSINQRKEKNKHRVIKRFYMQTDDDDRLVLTLFLTHAILFRTPDTLATAFFIPTVGDPFYFILLSFHHTYRLLILIHSHTRAYEISTNARF